MLPRRGCFADFYDGPLTAGVTDVNEVFRHDDGIPGLTQGVTGVDFDEVTAPAKGHGGGIGSTGGFGSDHRYTVHGGGVKQRGAADRVDSLSGDPPEGLGDGDTLEAGGQVRLECGEVLFESLFHRGVGKV
jgi:hypothetical protein